MTDLGATTLTAAAEESPRPGPLGRPAERERGVVSLEPESDHRPQPDLAREQHLQLGGRPLGDGFAESSASTTQREMKLHQGKATTAWSGRSTNSRSPSLLRTSASGDPGEFLFAYDPRVTWLEDRYYVTWCNGYHGPTIGVAYTHDFRTFHQLENAFLPFNRNGVLFPRRIGESYVMLSRPSDNGPRRSATSTTPRAPTSCTGAGIVTSWPRCRSPGSRPRSAPARHRSRRTRAGSSSITASSPRAMASCTRWAQPCSTWRSRGTSSRGRDYFFSPQVPYEQVGDVPNVVFPCAALVDHRADRISIYYGAADTVVCLAHGYVSRSSSS